MKNRLLARLRKTRKGKLFCAYLTLGFPNVKFTEKLFGKLEAAGVDILELGFPFSDPLADGPTIQMASECALRKGVRFCDAFGVMRKARKQGVTLPVLFFSYLNPILHYGIEGFCREAKKSGFDGAIIPDLPIEEGVSVQQIFHQYGLMLVYLVAPTTPPERMKVIAKRSDGFIYYVSVRGVTGARGMIPKDLVSNLRLLKESTRKPVLVGFGVSSGKQARTISAHADGVIVGSAIINQISKSQGKTERVVRFLNEIAEALH